MHPFSPKNAHAHTVRAFEPAWFRFCQRHLKRRACRLALPALLLVPLLAPAPRGQAQPLATSTPALTPSPPAAAGPDACEPNDTLVAPCALPAEFEQAGLNFADGSPDVFSFFFKGGRVYAITAASSSGADPAIRVFLAGAPDAPLAENDDAAPGRPDAAVQVAVPADGWYLVEVTNRAPGDMRGRPYTLAARSSAAPTPQPLPAPSAAGDMLENNYDLDHAARIGWGVPYDLSLACPDARPDACRAGDHDFLLLPAKRGVPLIVATYDLGPGADTSLVLYRPDPAQASPPAGWRAVASNDDIAPGRTLRSQAQLTPDWDGDALLVVAASERRTPPAVPAALGPAGRYRLIAGSPALAAIQAVLAAQGDLPQPAAATSTADRPAALVAPPSSVAAPAPGSAQADAEEIIKEACTTGAAVVARDNAAFYSAANPASPRRLLASYLRDTRVTLLGACYLGWVKAQPAGSVTPGWMFAPDLALLESADPANLAQPAAPSTPAQPSAAPPARPLKVVRVTPAPTPVPTPARRQALSVAVRVIDDTGAPRAGVRVVLVDAFGQTLTDARTPADGQVVFTPDLAPGSVVWVQLPAAGISARVSPADPALTFTLPRGGL